ncbi:hypothetical protein [Candidatus Uabimicrobium amorphum]|uniref:Helix-turn-helix type 11 domain-containing protein n=1 Tax=Uabimicrobium amorphum TaxID=2596890 RepID=A0A5S9F5U4_UABAM|nr:hypothetical protein [Candidatus Uabimicrobium amorphum]BBM87215.1 hypothetical protein UABAM_05618 [Candidatus Uabimicrobium amorphum]
MWQKKISHLFNILGQLSPYSQVTVESLAKEYKMSPKDVRKDVNIIIAANLGVFMEDDKIRISKYGYKRIRSWILS